jgi:hypothetical protein
MRAATLNIKTPRIMTLSKCHYAESFMLSVAFFIVILSGVMVTVVTLNVVLLSAVTRRDM